MLSETKLYIKYFNLLIINKYDYLLTSLYVKSLDQTSKFIPMLIFTNGYE